MEARSTMSPRTLAILGLGTALLLTVSACRSSPETEEAATTEPTAEVPEPAPTWHLGDLEVRNARVNLMPGMGALYLTVSNGGGEDDRLVSVSTPAAARAETHETVQDDGVMRMVPYPDGFQVPAGGRVQLAPGGKHVMLIDPLADLGAEPILVSLHFEGAGQLDLEVPVSDLTGRGAVAPEGASGGSGDHGAHGGHQSHPPGHDD